MKTLSPKKKILIVDDDPSVRDVFEIIFQNAGYDVVLEEDGNKLLTTNFSLPDIFIIDKLLSGVNGLDVCRHLKSQTATKDIPVILISASPGIGIQSQQAGADDYIEKPFDRQNLLDVVAKNISLSERRNQTRQTNNSH